MIITGSLCLCNRTTLGAVQYRRAENIAIGPRLLNGSSTLCAAKSGSVTVNWNLLDAAKFKLFIRKIVHRRRDRRWNS